MNRSTPRGYASTAVWLQFNLWADKKEIDGDDPSGYNHNWLPDWEAFRDGYSAGLAEQDV